MRRLDTAYRAFAAAAAGGSTAQQEAALRQAIAAYFEQPEQAQQGQQAQPEQAGEAKAAELDAGGPSSAGAAHQGPGSSNNYSSTGAGGSSCCSQLLQALDVAGLPLRPGGPALLHAARAVLRRNAEQAGPALGPLGLARVLHGLGSPAAPAAASAKLMGSFWGCHAASDFGVVLRAAEIACRDSGSAAHAI